MWKRTNQGIRRTTRFFRVGLNHDSLATHYQMNFAMIQHHKWSLTELDNMIPFERQIYIDLLMTHIEEENERMEQQNNQRGY